ncbi:MAG TPA: PIN domain-containing protein [Gemmatimonadaceae bacterium]
MAFLCDTSVLIAASDTEHQHHARSLERVSMSRREEGYCAAHSLAEMYAALSATRSPRMRRVGDVLVTVEQAASRFKPVSLTAQEYIWVVRHVAAAGARSGQVYDALILKCAEKCGARAVYTWNTDHFMRVAWPAVAAIISTP